MFGYDKKNQFVFLVFCFLVFNLNAQFNSDMSSAYCLIVSLKTAQIFQVRLPVFFWLGQCSCWQAFS